MIGDVTAVVDNAPMTNLCPVPMQPAVVDVTSRHDSAEEDRIDDRTTDEAYILPAPSGHGRAK